MRIFDFFLPDRLKARPEQATSLPYRFLSTAFQTAHYRADAKGDTASHAIIRRTVSMLGLLASPKEDDERRYLVNQAGATAVFSLSSTQFGDPEDQSAMLVLTQATRNAGSSPLPDSEEYGLAYVFEGRYADFGEGRAFYFNHIAYRGCNIPANPLPTDDKRDIVRVGRAEADQLCGLAMGENLFQQFLNNGRLSPVAARFYADRLSPLELDQNYKAMKTRRFDETIAHRMKRMPQHEPDCFPG